jgi:GxxExxY protein
MDAGSVRPASPGNPVEFGGDLTHEAIGAFYEVYNSLRFGFLESVYTGALHVELLERGIPTEREALLSVRYKGQVVGAYRADLIVDGRLILEIKSLAKAGHPEKRQLLHYLRATDMRLGLVLNFGPSAQFLRVINS